MGFDVPIAFFVFNRPSLTERVFAEIARVKPRRLFIAADGPRHSDEAEACRTVRSIVERIDWPCEVQRDYSERNLGCAIRESSAVDWVFSNVEEAIFLEDDTLPDPSFFSFSAALLDRYRDDERVMHIGGCNFQPVGPEKSYSYYFSRYAHGWGWATWRRAWRHYDFRMQRWPEFREAGLLHHILRARDEIEFWSGHFERDHSHPVSYDYQWYFAIWSQGGLSVLPSVNLVSNIGFGVDATHTIEDTGTADRPRRSIDLPLVHPPFVVPDEVADRHTFECVLSREQSLQRRIRRLLRSLPQRLHELVRASSGMSRWR